MDYDPGIRPSRRKSKLNNSSASSGLGSSGGASGRFNDDPRRSAVSSRSGGSGSGGGGGSPPRRKKKPAGNNSAEDALAAKMKAKKNRAKGGGGGSKAEDALEAKIRKKNEAAAAANTNTNNNRGSSTSRRGRHFQEEKREVDASDSDYGHSDEERGYDPRSSGRSSRSSGGGLVASSGVPVAVSKPEEDDNNNGLFTVGGGDVRSRPKVSQPAQAMDPLRQAELEKERNKKNVNSRYADLHETGQWGGLTRWEQAGICVLSLGAIVAAIVLGVQFGSGEDTPAPTGRPSKEPTQSPSTTPTLSPTDTDYRETQGLELMSSASPILTLPQTPDELVGARQNPESTPQAIAAEYILFDDPLQLGTRDPRFMERYALIVFYYQNGGCANSWITSTNWMNDEDHCTTKWYGIECDLKGRVQSITMSKNYVEGVIPKEFMSLGELMTLDLSNNNMVGSVMKESISMSKMYTVQLNNNKLGGEFPFGEVKDGATNLGVLWIQENTGLGGTITESYCTMDSITLDCNNFEPQPTYPLEGDSGLTTFEEGCLSELGRSPKEYTCNFDVPEPYVKLETNETVVAPVPSPPAVCGTPRILD